jgi:predicted nucleic acid-binding protein
MIVVVTDVSVLFDLFEIQAIAMFFALDLEIYTTDIVYNEILDKDQIVVFEEYKNDGKLIILDFDSEEESAIAGFKTNRMFKSLADKTILWKAIQMKAVLLTCDGKLRDEAIEQKLTVHGSIWVIEQMVKEGVVSEKEAALLLEALMKANNRLPIAEIEKLMKKYRK